MLSYKIAVASSLVLKVVCKRCVGGGWGMCVCVWGGGGGKFGGGAHHTNQLIVLPFLPQKLIYYI